MSTDGMDGFEEHCVLYIIGAVLVGLLLGASGIIAWVIEKLGR